MSGFLLAKHRSQSFVQLTWYSLEDGSNRTSSVFPWHAWNVTIASPTACLVHFMVNGQFQDHVLSCLSLLLACTNASRTDWIDPCFMDLLPSHLHATFFTPPHHHGYLMYPFHGEHNFDGKKTQKSGLRPVFSFPFDWNPNPFEPKS